MYVDNDPLVLVHARALLTSTPEGVTNYVEADLHEPEKIVQAAAETLNFDEPIAVMLLGILGHVEEHDEARSIVRRLIDAVPSGSYLTISDGTNTNEAAVESIRQYNETAPLPYHMRSPEQIAAYFEGMDLVEPGVVLISEWRPNPETDPRGDANNYGGVARKP